MVKGKCYFCGADIELSDKIFRNDTCPKCRQALHCCLQCKFYAPGAYNQCSEPMAERVIDKEKANLCGYFVFQGKTEKLNEQAQAKKKLEELFKKK